MPVMVTSPVVRPGAHAGRDGAVECECLQDVSAHVGVVAPTPRQVPHFEPVAGAANLIRRCTRPPTLQMRAPAMAVDGKNAWPEQKPRPSGVPVQGSVRMPVPRLSAM
jgi:hypothetical protein